VTFGLESGFVTGQRVGVTSTPHTLAEALEVIAWLQKERVALRAENEELRRRVGRLSCIWNAVMRRDGSCRKNMNLPRLQ